jgi:hypothetical protein
MNDCRHEYYAIYRHMTSDVKCCKCGKILTHNQYLVYKGVENVEDEFLKLKEENYKLNYIIENIYPNCVEPAVNAALRFMEAKIKADMMMLFGTNTANVLKINSYFNVVNTEQKS